MDFVSRFERVGLLAEGEPRRQIAFSRTRRIFSAASAFWDFDQAEQSRVLDRGGRREDSQRARRRAKSLYRGGVCWI